MRNSKIIYSLIGAVAFVLSLLIVQELAYAARPATVPSTVNVSMYRFSTPGTGQTILVVNGVNASCATTTHQDRWGCTAFFDYYNPTMQNPGTVVPYPYGSTAVPAVSLQNDYLKNVVSQEMGPDFDLTALDAQAITSRTYAMRFSGNLNNSMQVFVPYRFERMRREDGDTAHNPTTTPTPNVGNCGSITGSFTASERKICDALAASQGKYMTLHDTDTPIDAEYRTQNGNPTNPCAQNPADPSTTCPTPPANCSGLDVAYFSEAYLRDVSDPINDGETRSQAPCNSAGLSQAGAGRWARGSTFSIGTPTPWSGGVKWDSPAQILTHYYTGIDLRDGSGNVLTPPLRWNMLNAANLPGSMSASASQDISVTIQNTGTETWNETVSPWAWSLSYQWCLQSALDCPVEDSEYWQTNGELPQTAPGASLDAELWLDAPAVAGTYRLVLDVCKFFPPMRAQSPQETQRVNSPEGWTCLGLQNPAWHRFEKGISVGP